MPTILVPGSQTTGAASQFIRLPNRTLSEEAARRRAFPGSRLVGTLPDLTAYAADINSENKRRSAINTQTMVTYPRPDGAVDNFDRMQAQWWYPGNPPAAPGSATAALTGYLAPWGIIW